MMRFFLLLAMLPALAFGAGNDIVTNQRNATDTSSIPRTVAKPPGTQDGLMGFNGATVLPVHWTIGQGLQISSGALIALPQAWADITGKPSFAPVATTGTYASLTGIPSTFAPSAHAQAWSTITSTPTTLAGYGITDGYPLTGNPSAFITQTGARSALSLTTTGTSGAATYNSTTGVLNVPNYAPGTGTVTSVTAGAGLSGGTITSSGTISMPNVGAAGTYVRVTTDAQGRVSAGSGRSFQYPARPLNAAFQISTTLDADVRYTVDINVVSLLLSGTTGRVYLDYADDSSFTTNVVTVNESPNGTGGVLNVSNIGPGNVSGWIPAGKWVRIRTANVSGTPTFTFVRSQEVLQ